MARAIEREPGSRYTKKQAGLIAQTGPCALVIVSHALLAHNPQSFAAALSALKQIPQELVVDVVVILHFRGFHESPQKARTAIG